MQRTTIAILLTAAATALAGCQRGADSAANDSITVQNGAAAVPAGPAPAERHGQDFVSAVLGRYDFAIQSARTVAGKADRPEVKQNAQRMADDLSRSRDALTAIVSANKLKPDAIPVDTALTDMAVLQTASGAPLVTAFAERQLDNLSQLIGLMRAYGDGGDDPQLKSWAAKDQAIVNDRMMDLQTLNAINEESRKQPGA